MQNTLFNLTNIVSNGSYAYEKLNIGWIEIFEFSTHG